MENLKLRITFPNGSTAEVDAGPAKGPDGAKQTRATLSDAHGNKISLSGKLDGELALHDEDEQYTITIRYVPKEENEEELYSSWPPHEQNPLPEIRRTVPKTFRVSMCVDPEKLACLNRFLSATPEEQKRQLDDPAACKSLDSSAGRSQFLFEEEIPFPNDARISIRIRRPEPDGRKATAEACLYHTGDHVLRPSDRPSRMDGKWSLLDGDGNTYTVTILERNKKASPEPCRTASMIKVPQEPSFAMQKMQCRARNLLEQFDKKTGR